jgi:A/G-specific adenine glycosylase
VTTKIFQNKIWDFYRKNGRDLPWRPPSLKLRRGKVDPYRILVSEVMLQQTQVSRVLIKYREFLKVFPTVHKLAAAPLPKVLKVWQGLGYNRRALMLKQAAVAAMIYHTGALPMDYDELLKLPGVGPATAAGILNFAFNIPTVYLETNVRSVYLHFFFPGKKKVSDMQLMPLIEKTMDRKNPREWFYALLDYGVHLKATRVNPSRRSAHYVKQSKFEGSNRQKRAAALREALAAGVAEEHLLRLLS